MAYATLKDLLKGICDAVRAKKGTTGEINHQDIPSEIESIATGADVSGVTATAGDVLSPKVFVDANGEEKIGTIQTKTSANISVSGRNVSVPKGYYPSEVSKNINYGSLANPSISVDADGLISAVAMVSSSGYLPYQQTSSSTYQLNVHSGGTYTPTTYTQVIPKDAYLKDYIYIEGDNNLIPANIAKGKTIFGIEGTHEGGGSGATFGTYYTATRSTSDSGSITFNNVSTTNLIGFVIVMQGSMTSSTSTTREEIVSIVYYGTTLDCYVNTNYNDAIEGGLTGGLISVSTASNSITVNSNYSSTSVRFKSGMTYALYPIYSK